MNTGVGDIVERSGNDSPKPPSQQQTKQFTKKWQPRRRPLVLDPTAREPDSVLKHQTPARTLTGQTEPNPSDALSESERIHLENIRKIQQMSQDQIERDREEIFRSMDPSVLESLLRRAERKEESFKKSLNQPDHPVLSSGAPRKGTIVDWDPTPEIALNLPHDASKESNPTKDIKSAEDDKYQHRKQQNNQLHGSHPSGTENTVADQQTQESNAFHFAEPPDDLRKYFPDLPVETDKLAWMQPISESEEGEYSAELVSVAPSELRFDFKGNLVTPKQSRLIPTSAGLHHHGDAPSAAGYTLPELAHLCRSSHPGQRSIAIQTSGRVLHKLKLREYAKSSDLQEGLDALVKQTRIMDTLVEAADEKTRSLTVRTLATEALWLANAGEPEQKHSKIK